MRGPSRSVGAWRGGASGAGPSVLPRTPPRTGRVCGSGPFICTVPATRGRRTSPLGAVRRICPLAQRKILISGRQSDTDERGGTPGEIRLSGRGRAASGPDGPLALQQQADIPPRADLQRIGRGGPAAVRSAVEL